MADTPEVGSGKEQQPSAPSRLEINDIDQSGIIRVLASGFWTPSQIDMHFDKLEQVFERARRIRPHVRLLLDQRDSGAQTPETVERMTGRIATAFRDGDRVAMVVSSSLAKMQLRRAIRNVEHELFMSMSAAETWLMAYG